MNNNLKRIVLLIGGVFFLHSNLINAATLRDSVVRTIETNPNVLYSIKNWLASEQGIQKARGGFFPKVDVVAEVGEQNSKNYFTNFEYKDYTASGAGISLRQLIFDGFATSSLVASNKGHTLAAKYQVIGTANDIALLATKAYLDVLTTSKVVSLARANYAMMQNIANVAKHKNNRADINLAQGRVALAKADLLAAENNYTSAQAAYYKIVGIEPTDLVIPDEPIDSSLPISREHTIKNALAIHPTLKSADASVVEALAQYNGSKANYYPRVHAVLRAQTDDDMDGVHGNQVGEEAMLQLSYNIFHGGSDTANQKQAGYLVGQAQKSRDIVYNQIVENAKLAWDGLNTAKNQINYLKQHRDAANASAAAYYREYKDYRKYKESSEKQYRDATTDASATVSYKESSNNRSLVDVLNTQTESYKSEVSYVEGRSNLFFAKYWVLNSEGHLLSYFQVPTDISSSPTTIVTTQLPEVKTKAHQVNNEVVKPVAKPTKKVVASKVASKHRASRVTASTSVKSSSIQPGASSLPEQQTATVSTVTQTNSVSVQQTTPVSTVKATNAASVQQVPNSIGNKTNTVPVQVAAPVLAAKPTNAVPVQQAMSGSIASQANTAPMQQVAPSSVVNQANTVPMQQTTPVSVVNPSNTVSGQQVASAVTLKPANYVSTSKASPPATKKVKKAKAHAVQMEAAPVPAAQPANVVPMQEVAPASTVREQNLPSYKVKDTRISSKAMNKYTIQLYSSYAKDDAIDFIVKNHIQEKAAFYVTKEADRNKYVVVYGSYAGHAAAVSAIKSVSKELQAHNPVIRQLSQVNSEVSM